MTTQIGPTAIAADDPPVDQRVLDVQEWLNATYGPAAGAQWIRVPETGRTGWSTMYGLTRALQHELGIATLSNNFGDGTLAALTTQFPTINSSTTSSNPAKLSRVVKIIQGGLYCKGYNPNGLDGGYGPGCTSAVASLRSDMGLTAVGTMIPKVFKGLLTMDAYVLLPGGTSAARGVQQWLNATYLSRKNFFVMPCDGLYSRNTQKALVYALQYEIGLTDAEATGTFGPGTRGGISESGLFGVGAQDSGGSQWVRLFHAALIFNKIAVAFDSVFSSADSMSVTAFQNFCKLAPTGAADYQTWCSLLVSNGDPERPGTACDGITEVTAPRAATLWNSGYRYVGRYLTNALNSQLNKKIQPGELSTIFSAGLRVFPIYQTYGGEASYFNATQGRADARDAFNAALAHGFKRGTVVYFAVDYDAQDAEIDANILPHFRAIAAAMAELGSKYRVGVYGSRNVCARVSARGYAKLSFVSGMSTGFSGNLGYLLPSNWAFDQIATKTIGTGTGLINIDNNIASGRDIGQSVVDVDAPVLDVPTPLASIPNYSTFIQDYFWWFEQATTPIQQAVVLHPPQDVFEAILGQHDDLLTSLARGYGMRKSLIETAVLWESSVENILDVGTDAIVRATYAYLEQKEWWDGLSAAEQAVTPAPVPPPVQRRDASTGVSQIFAWVAAEVIDWARALGLTDEPSYDVDDWHQQRDLWMRLNEDDAFNIRMCALVLLWSAADRGIDISQPTFFTDQEIKDTLARYNGTNQDAIAYGERSFGLYSFLESRLNGPARAAAL
ncbi:MULTISPECIES: glycoside hydrolase domain-containing protein [Cellulosimicrobium]